MRTRYKLYFLLVVFVVAGCASFAKYEGKTGVEVHENIIGSSTGHHPVAVHPENFTIQYPGFLIGLEKGNHAIVGHPTLDSCGADTPYCFDTHASYFDDLPKVGAELHAIINGRGFFAKLFGYAKVIFPSHIARFSQDKTTGEWKTCMTYNVYGVNADKCEDLAPYAYKGKGHYFGDGWDAMVGLKNKLRSMIATERATHVFVFSMGWNTLEGEAIKNFRDLYKNLVDSAKADNADFRPVFIGFSWPSMWDNVIGRNGGDFSNKKNDADEVGAIWVNLLLQGVVMPLKKEFSSDPFKVALVGHSFGARILSRAVFSSALLDDNAEPVDLLVGLQGAFTLNRFIKNGASKAPYRKFPKNVRSAFFTTSVHDFAVGKMAKLTGTPYVGSGKAFELAGKEAYSSAFSRQHMQADGTLKNPDCGEEKITMVESNDVIDNEKLSKVSGAHSDIYSKEIGKFLWQVTKACAS